MWFILALLSAVLYSFRGVLEKLIVGRVDRYILGLSIRLFALPFFFVPFIIKPELFVPLTSLPRQFWIVVILTSFIFTPLETYFYYKSIKDEEISLALPILSLSPVMTIIFAVLFLHEFPTVFGAIGVVTILFGVYALKIGHARHGLLEPLLHLSRNKSVRLMAIVAVSLALGSILDKTAVKASNAYMYALFNYICVSFALFIFAGVKARQHLGQIKTHFKAFSVVGAVVAGYTLLYLLALQVGTTAYVVAIRNASLLISILLGVFWLKEKDLRTKLLAGSVIVAGLILIKVFG
ncbi:MAG TPA: EamA family transporter [Patescibacteria group bacterium]|nr:EamA family transporter [Patescibacteria group bacterium]